MSSFLSVSLPCPHFICKGQSIHQSKDSNPMIHYWNEATADWSDFLYATKLFHFFLFSFIFFPFTFFRFVCLLFFFLCIYLRLFFSFSFPPASPWLLHLSYSPIPNTFFSFYFIFLMVSPFLFAFSIFWCASSSVFLRLCLCLLHVVDRD